MARKERVHLHGGIYHVMLRGNGGMNIFASDEDRCRFLLLLQEGSYRFGFRVHAYCLMSNHVHFAIQVSDVPLSNIMQNLSFRYTRWFNYRQKRFGHLFQGRYKAVLVDHSTYLLALVRYIHLNPVRANMVELAEDYDWSGHNAYLGFDRLPWLTTDFLLGQLSSDLSRARQRYSEFVNSGMDEDHAKAFHQPGKDARFLGDDDFMDRVQGKSKKNQARKTELSEIIALVSKHYSMTEAELRQQGRARKAAEARGVIGYLVTELNAATLTELAEHFHRDISTMSN